jgi:hypothetical protein
VLIQLAPGRSPGFFGSDHPAAGDWQPGVARDVSDAVAAVLLALEGFEHIHDESCHHPADEATESHEEGL